ncbi:MAG: hypothetical protein HOC91_19515 [Nitrospinaceae bacterium]|jgi:hypothetical protein|nr:hypothetical protein [Nitrospinaceae bacterium]MBT3821133.1 hypothetical protein [Nitrospinaceae bacterium]MBT4432706.1 hypothetical protein [Nitrospinaceae bacterium]MBT6393349.1 hypothetical protein [Nitrospinaceae bacterium]
MSRVPLLSREGTEGDIAQTFNILGNFQSRLSNSTQATANSPFLARIFYPFVQTLMREGLGTVLSSKIKEIAVIKTTLINGCEY